MTRENGYYWVLHTEIWEIAEWFVDHWECIGMDISYQDSDFNKIGEKVERKEWNMKDTSGSAFPSKRFAVNDEERDGMGYFVEPGMSLRDYFAGQALIAKFSNDEYIRDLHRSVGMEKTNIIARDCYSIADAMLAERLK